MHPLHCHHHCFINNNVLTLRYLHQELEAALRLDVCTKQPEHVSPLESVNAVIERIATNFSSQKKAEEATSSALQRRHVDDYFGESLNGMGSGLFDDVRTVMMNNASSSVTIALLTMRYNTDGKCFFSRIRATEL